MPYISLTALSFHGHLRSTNNAFSPYRPFTHVASLMSTVYEEQKDEDGFLYVQYSGESTFGS